MNRPASPQSATILATYRCNAACTNCCFQSNPKLPLRSPGLDVIRTIDSLLEAFPGLRLLVFSGGEVTLYADQLGEWLAYARSKGLATRIVSNGGWAKSTRSAKTWIARLKSAGLDELNLSTGDEHAEFVHPVSVFRAAAHAVRAGISTTIICEGHAAARINGAFLQSNRFIRWIERSAHSTLFSIIDNVWMSFVEQSTFKQRKSVSDISLSVGCNNIIDNIAINPNGLVYSCCGLTMEYIDDLILGHSATIDVKHAYQAQFLDPLKMAIWLDGPAFVLQQVSGEVRKDGEHACESCLRLHQTMRDNKTARDRLGEMTTQVMIRSAIKREQRRRQQQHEQ